PLAHFEMRPGGFDDELFAELLPAEALVELRRRRAGVAPELIRIPLARQHVLGDLQHVRADPRAAQIIAHGHSPKLPRRLSLPRPANERGAADDLAASVECAEMARGRLGIAWKVGHLARQAFAKDAPAQADDFIDSRLANRDLRLL